MSNPKESPDKGRKIVEFCAGFVLATGMALAVAFMPIGSPGWLAVCGAALLGAAVCPLLVKRGYRYVVIGMLCALILPGLMVGSACVGVRLHY